MLSGKNRKHKGIHECLHCKRIGHMPYLWKPHTNAPMSTLHLDANAWTQHGTESTRPNANHLIVNFVATYEPLRKRSLQRAISFLTRTWRHQAQQPWQGDHTQNRAKQYGSINSSAKASIYRLIMIDLKHQDDLCQKSGVPNHFPCAQKEGMHEGTGGNSPTNWHPHSAARKAWELRILISQKDLGMMTSHTKQVDSNEKIHVSNKICI